MNNLTLKERERLAYINGDVELAKLLGKLEDALDAADPHEECCGNPFKCMGGCNG